MKESKTRQDKPQAIDLGLLQKEFQRAKSKLAADGTKLVLMQETFDRSKAAFELADAALKNGMRTVIG